MRWHLARPALLLLALRPAFLDKQSAALAVQITFGPAKVLHV